MVRTIASTTSLRPRPTFGIPTTASATRMQSASHGRPSTMERRRRSLSIRLFCTGRIAGSNLLLRQDEECRDLARRPDSSHGGRKILWRAASGHFLWIRNPGPADCDSFATRMGEQVQSLFDHPNRDGSCACRDCSPPLLSSLIFILRQGVCSVWAAGTRWPTR